MPKSVLSYAHCVREDPVRRGCSISAPRTRIYVSFRRRAALAAAAVKLPHAPVHWLTVQEHFNDLVVATYGRGFWILDDITPLRQLTPQVVGADAHLFAPRPAYRFRNITEPMMMPDDPTEGRNPPDGADINYYLKAAPADAARDAMRLSIADASGQLVRTLPVGKTATAGINRVWWDLRGEPTPDFKLRTSPIDAPEFRVGPDGTRTFPTGGPMSVLVPPGTYTVKLVVGGRTLTAPLVVRKDPNTAGTEADIRAQTSTMLEIHGDLAVVAGLINRAEAVRAQLATLKDVQGDDPAGRAARTAAEALDAKIAGVESHLFNMTATGRGQDFLRTPSQMVEKLLHLADVVSLADFAPTDQQLDVQAKLRKEIAGYRDALSAALESAPEFRIRN